MAARYAQYTNFGGTVEGFQHKSEILRGHCADVGRDFDEIVRSTNFNVVCAQTEAEVADKRAWFIDHYTPFIGRERAEKTVTSYFNGGLVGTPDQLVEKLREWEQAGMTYAISYFVGAAYDSSGLELFAREVIPAFG